MNTQPQQKISVQTLTQLAILVAIEVVMKLIGLGSVPVGPLYMSFLTVPIAIGAIVIGPMASMLLGGIFGSDPADSGEVIIEGKTYLKRTPAIMKNAGLGLTPEDRKTTGTLEMRRIS